MKKRIKANRITVLVIAAMLVSGVLTAGMLAAEAESLFGSEYRITAGAERTE